MTEIIQFKAGKVRYDEETKQCTPERGTGLIKVAKNPDDPMFYTFVWEPRGNHKTVAGPDARNELFLFPGDAQWTHVKQCTTGRVFALTFKSSGQKLIFWMQSPTDGDNAGDVSADDKSLSEKLQKLLEEPIEESQEQEQEHEQGDIELHDAPAEPTSDVLRTGTDGNNSQIPNLQELLSSINVPDRTQYEVPVMSIDHALPQSIIVEYINGLSQEQLAPLYEHLPQGIEHSRHELIRVIQSSQFHQGMALLSSVLNQGGGQIVASQLGMSYAGEGVEGFLRGIRRNNKDQDDSDKNDKMEE